MEKIVWIGAVRHGNKDGDELTPKGVTQVEAATLALFARGNKPTLLAYSGADHTWQCAQIARATLGIKRAPLERRGFHYEAVTNRHYGVEGTTAYMSELSALRSTTGDKPTVAHALAFTDYPRLVDYTADMRKQVQTALVELAREAAFGGHTDVLVFSHSPTLEMGVPDEQLDWTPYGIGETDAIAFKVLVDEVYSRIIDATFIPAPSVT